MVYRISQVDDIVCMGSDPPNSLFKINECPDPRLFRCYFCSRLGHRPLLTSQGLTSTWKSDRNVPSLSLSFKSTEKNIGVSTSDVRVLDLWLVSGVEIHRNTIPNPEVVTLHTPLVSVRRIPWLAVLCGHDPVLDRPKMSFVSDFTGVPRPLGVTLFLPPLSLCSDTMVPCLPSQGTLGPLRLSSTGGLASPTHEDTETKFIERRRSYYPHTPFPTEK